MANGNSLVSVQARFRFTRDDSALSEEERAFYEENGYLVFRNLIPHPDLDTYAYVGSLTLPLLYIFPIFPKSIPISQHPGIPFF
jgi:hypothetical protein